MIIDLTEKQAQDLAWCLLASIEVALKLGLGGMVSERIELLHLLAPAHAKMQDAAPTSTPSWLDSTNRQAIIHAIENMIRLLHTQHNQQERLCTYEKLLTLITATHEVAEEPRKEHDQ